MKMFHVIFVIFLLFPFSGCANIHSGNYATEDPQTDKARLDKSSIEPTGQARDLVISGLEIVPFSSKYLGILDFTFENRTSKWMRINSVSIDFGDPAVNSMVQVPVGSDLVVWYEAAQQRVDINNYNIRLALSAIAGVGGIASGAGAAKGNRDLTGIGIITVFEAVSVAALIEMDTELRDLQMSKVVPRNHLLSREFIIPPGLHTKKWILLYTPNPLDIPYLSSIFITLTLANGEERRMELQFRTCVGGFSRWQGEHRKVPEDITCVVR